MINWNYEFNYSDEDSKSCEINTWRINYFKFLEGNIDKEKSKKTEYKFIFVKADKIFSHIQKINVYIFNLLKN